MKELFVEILETLAIGGLAIACVILDAPEGAFVTLGIIGIAVVGGTKLYFKMRTDKIH